MNDAYDQNETDVGISLDTIEDEIRSKGSHSTPAGWPEPTSMRSLFAGQVNAAWVKRRSSEEWVDRRFGRSRTSKLTECKVCRVMLKRANLQSRADA